MKFREVAIGGMLSILLAVPALSQAADDSQQGSSNQGTMQSGSNSQSGSQSQASNSQGSQGSSQGSQGSSQQASSNGSPAIKVVQAKLKEQGYYKGQADGKWGPKSVDALRQFQQKKDLNSTGVMNEDTADALSLSDAEFAAFEDAVGQPSTGRSSGSQGGSQPQSSNTSGGQQSGSQSPQASSDQQQSSDQSQASSGQQGGDQSRQASSGSDSQQSGSQSQASSGDQQSSKQSQASNQGQGAVKNVQAKLKSEGYYRGHVDGIWGPVSATALMRYQKDKNIEATGKMNQATADQLGLSQAEFSAFESATSPVSAEHIPGHEPTPNNISNQRNFSDSPSPTKGDSSGNSD